MDKPQIPPLAVGEQLLFERSMPAKGVIFIEIGVGAYWLATQAVRILIALGAIFWITAVAMHIDLQAVLLYGSGAILAISAIFIASVFVHDCFVSGEETHVVTNRRIMYVDRARCAELSLMSGSLNVLNLRSFGNAGLLIFSDFGQKDLVVVIVYRDESDAIELRKYLPETLLSKMKDRLPGA